MAFSELNLQIEEILQTDFVPDAFVKVNTNFVEIQSNFEDLINNFEIDIANKKIGTDNPIALVRTENIVLKAGSLLFQTSVGSQVASLELDSSNESVFTVDHLISNIDFSAADISASGTVNLVDLIASGTSTLQGKVTMTQSPAYIPQTVQVQLTYNTGTNYAEGEITLTNSSRKHSYLELLTDATTYSAGAFNPLINGIKITVKIHASTPPVDGTELTLFLYRIASGSTNVTTTYAGLDVPIDLIPYSTLAIQDNTPGTLGTPIQFKPVALKSNITFAKITFSSQPRLIIIAEKNMTTP